MDAGTSAAQESQDPEGYAAPRAGDPGSPAPLKLEEAFELFEALKPFSTSLQGERPVVELLSEVQQRDPAVAIRLLGLAKGLEDDEAAQYAIDDQLGASMDLLTFLHRGDVAEVISLAFALGILE